MCIKILYFLSVPWKCIFRLKYLDSKWIKRWYIDTYIPFGGHFVKWLPARSFINGPIAENILKIVLLQHVQCNAIYDHQDVFLDMKVCMYHRYLRRRRKDVTVVAYIPWTGCGSQPDVIVPHPGISICITTGDALPKAPQDVIVPHKEIVSSSSPKVDQKLSPGNYTCFLFAVCECGHSICHVETHFSMYY